MRELSADALADEIAVRSLVPDRSGWSTAKTEALNFEGVTVAMATDALGVLKSRGWVTEREEEGDKPLLYAATVSGFVGREKLLKDRGRRHRCLMDAKSYPVADLVVALAMDGHVQNSRPSRPGMFWGATEAISEEAVRAYLHDHDPNAISEAVHELVCSGTLEWADGSRHGRDVRFLRATVSGRLHFRDAVRPHLGLHQYESILDLMDHDEIAIFYAWQASFKPSRNQVERALDAVIERANIDWNLVRPLRKVLAVDPGDGAIHINTELLQRIESSDFFLADLTPVYADGEVLCPNPNALFEAGFAMGKKPPESIFLVVQLENTAKLSQDHDAQRFPFDITSVNRIQYKSTADLRKQLASELQARLLARGWLRQ